MSKFLVVIGGPTASGKTSVAIQLAQRLETVILSCDSRQFYREMSIGTAKPTAEELAQARHYFVNSLSIHEEYTVGDFEQDALALLEKIYEEKDVAILAGGSGLFIRAVCEGLNAYPEVPPEIRSDLEQLWQQKGIEALQDELQQCDPAYYEQVDLQNHRRLIRALEVCRASGKPFSSFQNQPKAERFFQPVYILLDVDRSQLYERINQRVDKMLEAGLVEEAFHLYPFREKTALQTVGYQELFDHFDGKITLDEAVERIKRNSRRYAKRQLTWFRKRLHWKRFSPEAVDDLVIFIKNKFSRKF